MKSCRDIYLHKLFSEQMSPNRFICRIMRKLRQATTMCENLNANGQSVLQIWTDEHIDYINKID